MTSQPAEGLRIHECFEYATVPVPLSELLNKEGELDLREEVQSGYFAVFLKKNELQLRAEGWVGLIPLNERVAVRVLPRVPVERLTDIAHISNVSVRMLPVDRAYDAHQNWNALLLDHYATLLCTSVRAILQNGLLKSYRRHSETTSFPRGRVVINRTITRHAARGVAHGAEAVYFARTADNPANRCLKYAMWSLASQLQSFSGGTRAEKSTRNRLLRELNTLYQFFDAAALDHDRLFLLDSVVQGTQQLPTLRTYYRTPLDVAALVARRQSLGLEDSAADRLRLPSLVTHMPVVFEAFLRNVLARYANENAWPVQVYSGEDDDVARPLYTELENPKATPDILVIPNDAAQGPLPLEVKYMPKRGLPERPGVNQAVTYANVYGVDRVMLVQPCANGEGSGLSIVGTVGPVRLYLYRLDLGAGDLPGQIDAFGSAVKSIMPGPRRP